MTESQSQKRIKAILINMVTLGLFCDLQRNYSCFERGVNISGFEGSLY